MAKRQTPRAQFQTGRAEPDHQPDATSTPAEEPGKADGPKGRSGDVRGGGALMKGQRNWDRLVRQAERDMANSRAAINESRRGVPAGRPSSYRVGKSPSTHRETR